jgi:hypothetical protein
MVRQALNKVTTSMTIYVRLSLDYRSLPLLSLHVGKLLKGFETHYFYAPNTITMAAKTKKVQAKDIQGQARVTEVAPSGAKAPESELLGLIHRQVVATEKLSKLMTSFENKLDTIIDNQGNKKSGEDLKERVKLQMNSTANQKLLDNMFRDTHRPTDIGVEGLAQRIVGDGDPDAFNIAKSLIKTWFRNQRAYFASRIRTFAPGMIKEPEAREELTDLDLKLVLALYQPHFRPNEYEVEQAREVLANWPKECWDERRVSPKRKAASNPELQQSRKRGRFTYKVNNTNQPLHADDDLEKESRSSSEDEEDQRL